MGNSFKAFVTNAFNSFSPTDSAAIRWETANRLIREQGGTAVNIGAVGQDSDTPIWMLSSMSKEWLQQYVNDKLYEIDPFIPHLKLSNEPYVLDTTKRVMDQPLNHLLFAAGYSFLYGIPFNGPQAGERQVVTYCSDMTYTELQKGDRLERIRVLAAILISNFSAPNQRDVDAVERFGRKPLSPREKETLSWLAHGLRNDRIAERMDISEVMVRKHLNGARTKLGAATREQALGIALSTGTISL